MNINRLFAYLTAIVFCWMVLTSSQAETTPSDFEYTKVDESIVIQKYTGTESDVIIPDEIEGLPVTKLSGTVFFDVSVTSVFIPASVSEIDVDVFIECRSLESIKVYHNNKFFSSQDGVLFDKLKTTLLRYPPAKEGVEYKVPPTVTQLAEKAFEANQNLENVSLGSVREVPHRAFAVCQKLKYIGSDRDFISIGDLAFVSCGQLENIPVYSSTTSTKTIGSFAFRNCHSLRYVTIPNSVTNIGWGCFQNCTGLTNVSLGNGISVLNSQTFAGCTNLANVKLPNKLISIGTKEFENCEQLKELTFPSTFQEMIQDCFAGTHLDKITFKGNTPVITGYITTYDPVLSPEPLPPEFEIFSDHYPEIYYFDKTTGWNIEDYVLDSFEPYFQSEGDHLNGIVIVPLAAHCGMKGIPLIGLPSDFEYRIEGDEAIITNYLGTDLDVVFPNEINGKTVTGIDYYFWGNDKNNITSCQLPENLKYIGFGLFNRCTNLAKIQIPDSVETIGARAFSGCEKLTELHIPNGVKIIGHEVIASCKNIKTINIPAGVEDIYGGVYNESFWMNAFAWSDGLEEITVDEENPFYRAIDGVLFNKEGTTLLQYPCGRPGAEYVIPEGITKLAWASFLETIYLETVRFPSSLETINEYSFFKCSSLTSIDIPDTVQTIDSVAFAHCSNLKQVIVGTGVTSLKTYAFVSCPALESVYFKGNCPEIDESIFNGDVPNPYYPNVYYVKGTEGWDDPAKLDWLDPEKLFTWTPEAPYLFVSKKDPAGMKLVFSGELQSSDDLENWATISSESPYQDAPAQGSQKFFRVKK
ncbi:MAG: leucine-rich repeat domain-containing protein [Verrucomicrobia bacterium]|nr:leucine-rich repeat domain-containing protein [Verrucomicrobiota bacterium]